MPQFDFTPFSSQIFWFAICFVTLYLAASKVILPRITAIIAARKKIVDADKAAAQKLDSQIDELSTKTLNLRQKAGAFYKNKIDETLQKSSKKRERAIEELKNKVEEMNSNSRKQLQAFLESTKVKSAATIQDLVQKIKTKILN
jgi:F-type H+-transporting ATPase subunit b